MRKLFIFSLFLWCQVIATQPRPNLIFLFADDQCSYSLGCYGNEDVKTPNIDALARQGVAFDRHYNTTAICMASRVNVMTGLFEYRHGCNFDHGPLPESLWRKSYPMRLREAGYQTAFAGKFGFLIRSDKPEARPDSPQKKHRKNKVGKAKTWLPEADFDRWGGGPGQTSYVTAKNPSIAHYADEFPHSTRAYGAFGRDFIRDAALRDEPYCLSISFKAPHQPATPDPEFDAVYAGKKFAKPENFGREHGKHFSDQSRQGRQYERFHSWGYSERYDEVMAIYHQQFYGIDVAVGMIREAVKASGEADNTVIIYTSDNGFFCGSHGYGSKVLPYEESSRVPLIVYDPRHPNAGKRQRSSALTGNVDMAPTLLALAGLPVDAKMDGRSLLPLLDHPGTEVHKSLPLINVWGPSAVHSLAEVTKEWKFIYSGHQKRAA